MIEISRAARKESKGSLAVLFLILHNDLATFQSFMVMLLNNIKNIY